MSDGAARIVANKLQEKLGQPVVIENKAGAGGLIGGETAAEVGARRATRCSDRGERADSVLHRKSRGKRLDEWEQETPPRSEPSRRPRWRCRRHPAVPAKDSRRARHSEPRARTRQADDGNRPAPAPTDHLAERACLQPIAGATWTTVHYRGNAPATNDLIGRSMCEFNSSTRSRSRCPSIRDGPDPACWPVDLAPGAAKRIPDAPDLHEVASRRRGRARPSTALMAPAGTPAPVIARLSTAMTEILRDAEVMEKSDLLGAEAVAMSPEDLRKYLATEDATWMPIVRKANIKAD